jgi:hypothetical protein
VPVTIDSAVGGHMPGGLSPSRQCRVCVGTRAAQATRGIVECVGSPPSLSDIAVVGASGLTALGTLALAVSSWRMRCPAPDRPEAVGRLERKLRPCREAQAVQLCALRTGSDHSAFAPVKKSGERDSGCIGSVS